MQMNSVGLSYPQINRRSRICYFVFNGSQRQHDIVFIFMYLSPNSMQNCEKAKATCSCPGTFHCFAAFHRDLCSSNNLLLTLNSSHCCSHKLQINVATLTKEISPDTCQPLETLKDVATYLERSFPTDWVLSLLAPNNAGLLNSKPVHDHHEITCHRFFKSFNINRSLAP